MIGLSSCGGGGGSDDNADPTGFYDAGSATIKDPADVNSDKVLPDLRAMIAEDRIMIMIMSNENAILYDADITDIDGNDFTADVRIYYGMEITDQAALPPAVINTTMSGTINEGSQITATVAGTGIGTGSFSLTFGQSNSTVADLMNVDKGWTGDINSIMQSIAFEFEVVTGGVVVDTLDSPTAGLFNNCEMTGTVVPISNSTLFKLSINVTTTTCGGICGIQEGDHTGLVTTLDANHNKLIVMFSNATVAGIAEWDEVP